MMSWSPTELAALLDEELERAIARSRAMIDELLQDVVGLDREILKRRKRRQEKT
jgi:hypothetical protein